MAIKLNMLNIRGMYNPWASVARNDVTERVLGKVPGKGPNKPRNQKGTEKEQFPEAKVP